MVHFHFCLFPQRRGAEGPKAQMFAWLQFKLFKSYHLGKGESCKLDRVRSNWVTRHPLFKSPDKRQWLLLLLLYSHSAKKRLVWLSGWRRKRPYSRIPRPCQKKKRSLGFASNCAAKCAGRIGNTFLLNSVTPIWGGNRRMWHGKREIIWRSRTHRKDPWRRGREKSLGNLWHLSLTFRKEMEVRWLWKNHSRRLLEKSRTIFFSIFYGEKALASTLKRRT